MLLEVPLSMMAWLSVVIVQAIVHFGYFGSNNRRDEDCELSVETFELDDGEPPLEDFEELLSQTGDEVISVSYFIGDSDASVMSSTFFLSKMTAIANHVFSSFRSF